VRGGGSNSGEEGKEGREDGTGGMPRETLIETAIAGEEQNTSYNACELLNLQMHLTSCHSRLSRYGARPYLATSWGGHAT